MTDHHDPQDSNNPATTQRLCGGAGLPISVGWTGASGLPYGQRLVEVLLRAGRDVDLVFSNTVGVTAPAETGKPVELLLEELRAVSCEGSGLAERGKLQVFTRDQYSAPMASGSANGAGMVIVPCSMATVGRLVAGTSDSLLLRAADVCLKERRTLVVVPREMPLATHHLEHLAKLSAMGALVMPAAPGFYHRPESIRDLLDFVVQRVCDHLGVEVDLIPRWGVDSTSGGGREHHERHEAAVPAEESRESAGEA